MKFTWAAFVSFNLVTLSIVDASFLRDVVRSEEKTAKQDKLEGALLAKAIPLDDYRANLRAQGFDISEQTRRLEDGEEEEDDDNGDGDDYFINGNYMYSFSGYSLKYAKCQPVQRFSENAISAGVYTPMVTDDIAILRLCPYRYCSTSKTFGCHYNYAEYAIGLTDYVRIMLRYKMDKEEQLCDWCDGCYARRKLEQQGDDQAGDDQAGDDYAGGDDAAQAAADDDYKWWTSSGNTDDLYYSDDPCYSYKSYCYDDDGVSLCEADGDDDDGDDSYIGAEDYLDYLDCTNIKDEENYNYYVRPRCDGYKETIKMGIFYDKFCSQFAGDDVSLKNFGLGFKESFFEEFYSNAECHDCSESNNPPDFNANSNMCNRMHISGAKCTTNLQYDLFDDYSSDTSQCSFIESVRFGTYDEVGRLYTDDSFFGASRQTTVGQKWGLSISLLICGMLALYSCYMHHSITNLLIKSLSHTDLLPPSRSRRGAARSNSRGRRSRKRVTDDDDAWDLKGNLA